MQGGYIAGTLSQDAFHSLMKAYMNGELDAGGKSELQAGARAERMNKRLKPA